MNRIFLVLILTLTLSGCGAFSAWETNATPEEKETAAATADGAAATVQSVGTAFGPAGLIIAAPFAMGLALLAARIRRGPTPEENIPNA